MTRIFLFLLYVTVPSLLPGAVAAQGNAVADAGVWKSLPFDKAITIVRGDGRRKIAVFSDPNCPYCKRFEEDLAKLDDVTEYVFLYPVLSQSSVRKARAVWCAPKRAEAWLELMIYSEEPSARECEAPLEELVALGRRLGARVTPTWFVETGERFQGAYALEDVRQILDKASPRKP
jgi:thiol:disulfide interchange protein DsbC